MKVFWFENKINICYVTSVELKDNIKPKIVNVKATVNHRTQNETVIVSPGDNRGSYDVYFEFEGRSSRNVIKIQQEFLLRINRQFSIFFKLLQLPILNKIVKFY